MTSLLPLALLLAAGDASRIVMTETRGGVLIEDLVFKTRFNDWTAAYRVCPAGARPASAPAILFAHWLDSPESNSNRSQFLDEAIEFARKAGACGLLVDAMWSHADWFAGRDIAKDRRGTERQRDRIADALTFLLSSPAVDKSRVAYVGHDFGGMFGALLASSETRVQYWAIHAATPRWHEWYLLGRDKMEPGAKQAVIEATADLDPIKAIATARGQFFFQFATRDFYVPRDRAQQFFDAAPQPKKLAWYDAGHELNAEAARDRIHWLLERLMASRI
jgi:dienelactone hydrolase